jgi:hypothetical protein
MHQEFREFLLISPKLNKDINRWNILVKLIVNKYEYVEYECMAWTNADKEK